MNICRLDIEEHAFELFKQYVDIEQLEKDFKDTYDEMDEYNIYEIFLNKLNNPKIIKHSNKKLKAIQKATLSRSNSVKNKINNAINILRLENKQFTHYSISKTSTVAFQTVKKYIDDELLEKLNKKTQEKVY